MTQNAERELDEIHAELLREDIQLINFVIKRQQRNATEKLLDTKVTDKTYRKILVATNQLSRLKEVFEQMFDALTIPQEN